jgi:hypothetical protein
MGMTVRSEGADRAILLVFILLIGGVLALVFFVAAPIGVAVSSIMHMFGNCSDIVLTLQVEGAMGVLFTYITGLLLLIAGITDRCFPMPCWVLEEYDRAKYDIEMQVYKNGSRKLALVISGVVFSIISLSAVWALTYTSLPVLSGICAIVVALGAIASIIAGAIAKFGS